MMNRFINAIRSDAISINAIPSNSIRGVAPNAAAPLWPIAVARVLIGVLWLFSLRWKLPPSFDGGSERGLREWLDLEVAHAAFGFYGELIESVVIPNFTFFAWLLFLTELCVGLSLLLGYRVRIGALIGLGLSLNLGIGLLEVPGEWPWSYAMLAMWHGLFVATDAGRVWGLDGRLGRSVNQELEPHELEQNKHDKYDEDEHEVHP